MEAEGRAANVGEVMGTAPIDKNMLMLSMQDGGFRLQGFKRPEPLESLPTSLSPPDGKEYRD